MRPWHGLEEVPREWGRSVVTVGVFDGVHRGHQAIVRTAVDRARALGLPVVVVTFEPHPDVVVRGGAPPAVLTPGPRKAELLAECGADAVCVLPFTTELSRLGAEDFVHRVLVEGLGAAAVVVGEDFRFGHRASGDVWTLRTLGEKYGFTAEGLPLVTGADADADAAADTATSTRIRACLEAGDVEGAQVELGRPHRVEGVVVHGAARGRELLGFPTANLDCPPETAVPADGVYAGRMLLADPEEGAESSWPAAISVGTNPTFEGGVRTVEGYALDRDDLDLYDRRMAMEFTHRIRGQLRFDSVDELIEAMWRDVARARELALGGVRAGEADAAGQ
ncbi:bifunctional riboflavin kinase/FAD synthetase [Streptomonospora litoralis]|uniref:Riboflavin biosynthesis protein n=1 Tax=Streptomonospora litoralis TaxID=2498135 RepID=A0A4P6Q8V8_9ACTN|nr:bifunctional riboflavin kinase/FAD synthetase [Streptomonospora litoralis]QBI55574.1 Riboflavin biosynthesis protein RibF [Streptomonospora litoralis]